MNYFEFRQLAQQSAEIYLKYLRDHNKGISEVRVSHIRKTGRNVYLTLLGALSPASLDSIQLQAFGDLYPAEKIRPIDYLPNACAALSEPCGRASPAPDEGLLILKPDRDLFDLLPVGNCQQISIVSSLLFLVERVEKWYKTHAALLSLPTRPPNVTLPSFQEMAGGTPSEEQYDAVCGVLSSPLSYVWGAPGTGKTRYVLSNCVLSYLRADKRVLLAAPTNNALDQMLTGVISVLRGAGVPLACIRRLGIPSLDFQKNYPSVCENQSIERKRTQLACEVERLRPQLAALRRYRLNCTMLSAFTELQDSFVSAGNAYDAAVIPEDTVQSTQSQLDDASQRIEALDRRISELTIWRDSYPGRFSRLFFPKKYAGKIASLDDSIRARTAVCQDEAFYFQQLEEYESVNAQAGSIYCSQYDSLCARFRSLCSSSRNPSVSALVALAPEQIPSELEALLQTIHTACEKLAAQISPEQMDEAQISARLSAAEAELSQLDEESVADYGRIRVLAMTIDRYIASTVSSTFPDFVPEHIFMDEAAYCSLIKGCTLLGLDAPLTLLGDHAQLPPVCEMSDYTFQEMDSMPVFLWSQSTIHLESAFSLPLQELYEEYAQGSAPHFDQLKCFPLSVTYRFGPSLSRVLADLIYTQAFRSAVTEETAIRYISAPSSPDDLPRTSLSECTAVISLMEQLNTAQVDFAVLTPYKKQISLLRKRLHNPALSGRIMTVHASQGREFHTIILSVVDTTRKFFVNSKTPIGRSVLNTALSRAKSQLILVLDRSYWYTQDSQLIGQLLQIASPYTQTDIIQEECKEATYAN